MSEFVFKNLSVKLLPDPALAADEPLCVCCSYEVECGECSLCTDGPTQPPECGPCTDTPTGPPECSPCTQTPTDCGVCTDGPTDDCFPCTDFEGTGAPCFGPVSRPECRSDSACEDGTHCIDTIDIVLPRRSLDVVRGELAILRAELRRTLGGRLVEEQRLNVEGAQSVEEIDQLRDALLGAVAELDQRRTEIEAGPSD
jgi:hypothetical protein